MNNVLVLQCSPHVGGVSDSVANLFTKGMAEAGIEARTVALRDYAYSPCTGCGGCSRPPHKCILANRPLPGQNDACAQMDQTEEIFQMINEAQLVMASIPGDPLKGPDGQPKPLQLGTLFWLYVDSISSEARKR